jgi:hypothetical protein
MDQSIDAQFAQFFLFPSVSTSHLSDMIRKRRLLLLTALVLYCLFAMYAFLVLSRDDGLFGANTSAVGNPEGIHYYAATTW